MAPSPSKDALATHFMTLLGADWYPMYPSDHHVHLTVQQVEDLLKAGYMPTVGALKDADGVVWDIGPNGVKPR